MTSQVKIICLANSRKHGGGCVAGFRTDGSGWLRPVGNNPDGTLFEANYRLNDGTEPKVLDVLQVGLQSPRPKSHQPENWVIDGSRWTLISRPMGDELTSILQIAIKDGPELLGGLSDRVPYASFHDTPAAASLELRSPEYIELYHRRSFRGRPQARGMFVLGEADQAQPYDLAITDPKVEPLLTTRESIALTPAVGRFLMTVSLSEPADFDGNCYKLIAAIRVLPPSIAADL